MPAVLRKLGLLIAVLVVLAVPALVWSGQAVAESRIVCAGQANVPAGWIHTDSAFTPFVCGGGAIPVVPTQWVITRYDNLFRGDRLLVCDSAPLPGGWTTIIRTFEPYRCGAGLGTGIAAPPPNVKLIEAAAHGPGVPAGN